MALRTITYDTDIHKTATEWVRYFEEISGVKYARASSTFSEWLNNGVPQKYGGGEMIKYVDLPGNSALYEWQPKEQKEKFWKNK